MQRWIPILAVVLALQLALAGALALSRDRLAATKPDIPLVQADLEAIDWMVIDGPVPAEGSADKDAGKPAKVELAKQDGTWILPGAFDAPANQSKIDGVIDKLTAIKRGWPVGTTRAALKRFKVTDDNFERRLAVRQGETNLATLYLGSSPTIRKVHARTGADEEVYAVGLATYELPIREADWLDRSLLQREAGALASIEIIRDGEQRVKLVHEQGAGEGEPVSAWRGEGLAEGESLDPAKADALVRALTGLRIDGVLGTEARPEWQQDKPLVTFGIEDRDGKRQDWILSKPSAGNMHVLKASDRPWYFDLKEWNVKSLLESADRGALIVTAKAEASASAAAEEAAKTGNADTADEGRTDGSRDR